MYMKVHSAFRVILYCPAFKGRFPAFNGTPSSSISHALSELLSRFCGIVMLQYPVVLGAPVTLKLIVLFFGLKLKLLMVELLSMGTL